MTTDQPGAAPPPPSPNVAALVDAIDERARQAGTEGATAVMQRMLGSVTDVLGSIQDRLDHVEELLAPGHDAGGSGLAEEVRAGLATFNARLGRLEEAFVQAVDESGSGTQAVVDEVRTVVVRALEDSAASSAAAASPSTPTPLDPEAREALARVESGLASLRAAREERPAQEVVSLALTAMGERLEALASPPADLLRPVLERLDAVERRVGETPRDVSTSVEAAFEALQARFAGLEQLVQARSTERVDASATVRAALAPVVERVDELDAAARAAATRQADSAGRVEAALAAVPGRLTTLEERLAAVASSLDEAAGSSPVDAAVLARLDEAVERLERDESSARLVKLVEERLSAGLRAVTERTDEVRRAVDQLAKAAAASSSGDDGALDDVVASLRALQSATHEVPEEVASVIGSRLAPLGDRLGGLDERLDALQELVARSAAAAAAAPTVPDPTDALERLTRMAEGLSGRIGELAARPVPEAPAVPDHGAAIAEVASSVAAVRGQLDRQSDAPSMPDPTEALVRLEGMVASLSTSVSELAARPVPEPQPVADHGETIAGIAASLEAVRVQVADLQAPSSAAATGATSALVEQITGAVRREAELLTQRVAALAVGVEASRVLLEQHLQETESSLGRKAGEVTRRLAADFGIRSRRNGPGGRRDPRELGSG